MKATSNDPAAPGKNRKFLLGAAIGAVLVLGVYGAQAAAGAAATKHRECEGPTQCAIPRCPDCPECPDCAADHAAG